MRLRGPPRGGSLSCTNFQKQVKYPCNISSRMGIVLVRGLLLRAEEERSKPLNFEEEIRNDVAG